MGKESLGHVLFQYESIPSFQPNVPMLKEKGTFGSELVKQLKT